MVKNFTTTEINQHYARRHELRGGIYGEKPYANYGYWMNSCQSIDDACDAMTQLMADTLHLTNEDRLLECGCGYGASAMYLATHCPPASYTGLDATEVRVATAQQMFHDHGLADRFRVQLGDATHLPFEAASFDRVMAIECAFHFTTREDFLREAFRVLAPGGVLAMTDIVVAPNVDLSQWTTAQLRDFLGADLKCISDDNIYQADHYLTLLRQIGFEPALIESIKAHTIWQFADHLDEVAAKSESPMKERRAAVAHHFRNEFNFGGDYVVVQAHKP